MTRIEREKETVELMIRLYCRHHEGNSQLCGRCATLRNYAFSRLEHCKFGEKKSTCKKCPVHCYKPEMKEDICKVMRYAGPRMMLFHPIIAMLHLIHR